jgi:hypothetical protein
MKIIAVCGKMGSGKDFLMDNVVKPRFKNPCTVSFADQIKINVATMNNMSIVDMYGDKTPELRLLLQREGTELGRNKYGPDIWIKYVENWIKLREMRVENDAYLITDCRFRNEAEWIERNGGLLIKISAPDRNAMRLNRESGGNQELLEKIQSHPSETDLDDYDFKHIVDNRVSNVENSIKEFNDLLDHLLKVSSSSSTTSSSMVSTSS